MERRKTPSHNIVLNEFDNQERKKSTQPPDITEHTQRTSINISDDVIHLSVYRVD